MRDAFPEFYYKPDIENMWKNAIFVTDTNVLLNIFHFSPETSADLMKVLVQLKDQHRLWIPYQFAHEYLKNVPVVHRKIGDEYKLKKRALNKLCEAILQQLNDFDSLTDYELGERIDEIKTIFSSIKTGLEKFRQKHKNRLENDDLEGQIERLFEGRIGCCFSNERLAEVFAEGERRYKLGIPPGFKDHDKDVSRRYGDLVGWLQTLRYANGLKPKRPFILITDDSGGHDWFYKPQRDGNVTGPRPELVKEMRDKAGVDFYIYQTATFMEAANEYLNLEEEVTESTISEARNRVRGRSGSRYPMFHLPVLEQYDAVLRAKAEENARVVDAVTRPLIDAANANAARITAQALGDLSYYIDPLYGVRTSRRSSSDPDEREIWDDEVDSDEDSNNDPNDDNSTDDPGSTPTPVET